MRERPALWRRGVRSSEILLIDLWRVLIAVGEGGADDSRDSGGIFDDIVESIWVLPEGGISEMFRCVT